MKITFEPRRIGEYETLDLSRPGTIISAAKRGRRNRALDAAAREAVRAGALLRTRVASHPDFAEALSLDAEILTLRAYELESGKPIAYQPGDIEADIPIVIAVLDLDWGVDGSARGEVLKLVKNLWSLAPNSNAHILITTPDPPATIPLPFLRGSIIHLANADYREYNALRTQMVLRLTDH